MRDFALGFQPFLPPLGPLLSTAFCSTQTRGHNLFLPSIGLWRV